MSGLDVPQDGNAPGYILGTDGVAGDQSWKPLLTTNGEILFLQGDGPPDSALGSLGDIYKDNANLTEYGPKTALGWGVGRSLVGPQGATGATGADGADGAPGQDGAPGASFRSGSGVPAVDLGADGDSYIDTATGALYEKAGGSWAATGDNLRGPTGATGPDGPAGADGAPGADGAQGIQGLTGPAGADGADGAPGADGADGQGVPPGGIADQVLAKVDGTDFNTTWVTQTGGGGAVGIPAGTSVYASRTAAQAATVDGDIDLIAVQHDGMVLGFVRDASGTALTTGGGATWAPAGVPSVAHYGAVNDTSTDNGPAFQAAIAAHDEVFIPATPDIPAVTLGFPGYRIGTTIEVKAGLKLYGAGRDATILRATAGLGDAPVIARPDWDSGTADTDAGVNEVRLQDFQITNEQNTARVNHWTVDLSNGKEHIIQGIRWIGTSADSSLADRQRLDGLLLGSREDSGFDNEQSWFHVVRDCEFSSCKVFLNTSDSHIYDCSFYSWPRDYCIRLGWGANTVENCIAAGGEDFGFVYVLGDSAYTGKMANNKVHNIHVDGAETRRSRRLVFSPASQSVERLTVMQCDGFNFGNEVVRIENGTQCAVIGCSAFDADNFDNGLADIYMRGTQHVVIGNRFDRGATVKKKDYPNPDNDTRVNLGPSLDVVDDTPGLSTIIGNNRNGVGYDAAAEPWELEGLTQAQIDAKQDAASAFSGAYGDLSGVPGTFTPSVHTHAISAVTNLQSELDGKAASSHTHTVANVTGLQTELDGKADDAATTSALAGKAATSHAHTIANVTGLQTALDGKADDAATTSALAGKAATSHTHAIANVTNLQTELDDRWKKWAGTQAAYDALGTYDADTLYDITDAT